MSNVSRILAKIDAGDPHAAGELLPLVYDELRKLARAKLTQEKPGQTLQATALVHEAFLRIMTSGGRNVSPSEQGWCGRSHFFAAAAESMRRILVDSARRKGRVKHGGEYSRVELEDIIEAPQIREDLLALDVALDKLKQVDGTAAELVQLRYFAGLTMREAAEMLDVSERTAERAWTYARAWLRREIESADCLDFSGGHSSE